MSVNKAILKSREMSKSDKSPLEELHAAVRSGSLADLIVLIPILHEIEVDAKIKDSTEGYSALHCAIMECKMAQFATVNFLIHKAKSNVNLGDNLGNTALHYAIIKQQPEIVRILLRANNIDVNAKNNEGLTALHYAVKKGTPEILSPN